MGTVCTSSSTSNTSNTSTKSIKPSTKEHKSEDSLREADLRAAPRWKSGIRLGAARFPTRFRPRLSNAFQGKRFSLARLQKLHWHLQ